MDAMAIISMAGTAIGLVNKFILPMINKSGGGPKTEDAIQSAVDLVGAVVPALKEFGPMVPLVKDQVMATFTGVKNIIAAVGAHPATTEDQMKALKAFDKQADDAWDAIESQLDPDVPGNS